MTHEMTSYNTKKSLAEALKNAMRSKTFSKISVSELISQCGINRKTFYYHFSDIFALLQWMLAEDTFSIVRQYDLLNNYESAIRFAVEYVDSNDHIISCAFDSIGREEMKQFFYKDVVAIVSAFISDAAKEQNVMLEPEFLEYLAVYHSEALVGMFLEYARNRDTRDKEQAISYLIRIVRSAICSLKEM